MGSGREVWLRRVPSAEAPHRGLVGSVRRLARRAPRAAYDLEVWDDARLTWAGRTPHPLRPLVRRGGADRPAAASAVRSADAAPADWVTVPM
ncbi:hypothetical protein [Nocardioides sp. AX2bis]|uniref:hypothetical protein n=1 Tax=Nocardioides sp. AX2bis TaxID=2653157 RepID=UPI0012F2EA81|nr:hypothetical protein [Nocardioides sp. AX2bis]VXB55622.1 hypothetical protein NOCARDAX2BIS_230219 [Nocardioides sp. AX2bis]